jgi:hypothetical protein
VRNTLELLVDLLNNVYITSLDGLGSSYRMKGYFTLALESGQHQDEIAFEGVAFGGAYGGHNVSVSIDDDEKRKLARFSQDGGEQEIEELLTEIQRRLLNNEMIVDYDKIKPGDQEDLGNLDKI